MTAFEKSSGWKDVAHKQAVIRYLYNEDLAFLRGFRSGCQSVINSIEVQ